MAVAVLFTGNLGSGDFFHQCGCATDYFLGREGQPGDAVLQIFDVFVQAVCQVVKALGAVFRKQAVFDAMKTCEVRGFNALLMIVDPGVDRCIKVTEQLGNRLN